MEKHQSCIFDIDGTLWSFVPATGDVEEDGLLQAVHYLINLDV